MPKSVHSCASACPCGRMQANNMGALVVVALRELGFHNLRQTFENVRGIMAYHLQAEDEATVHDLTKEALQFGVYFGILRKEGTEYMVVQEPPKNAAAGQAKNVANQAKKSDHIDRGNSKGTDDEDNGMGEENADEEVNTKAEYITIEKSRSHRKGTEYQVVEEATKKSVTGQAKTTTSQGKKSDDIEGRVPKGMDDENNAMDTQTADDEANNNEEDTSVEHCGSRKKGAEHLVAQEAPQNSAAAPAKDAATQAKKSDRIEGRDPKGTDDEDNGMDKQNDDDEANTKAKHITIEKGTEYLEAEKATKDSATGQTKTTTGQGKKSDKINGGVPKGTDNEDNAMDTQNAIDEANNNEEDITIEGCGSQKKGTEYVLVQKTSKDSAAGQAKNAGGQESDDEDLSGNLMLDIEEGDAEIIDEENAMDSQDSDGEANVKAERITIEDCGSRKKGMEYQVAEEAPKDTATGPAKHAANGGKESDHKHLCGNLMSDIGEEDPKDIDVDSAMDTQNSDGDANNNQEDTSIGDSESRKKGTEYSVAKEAPKNSAAGQAKSAGSQTETPDEEDLSGNIMLDIEEGDAEIIDEENAMDTHNFDDEGNDNEEDTSNEDCGSPKKGTEYLVVRKGPEDSAAGQAKNAGSETEQPDDENLSGNLMLDIGEGDPEDIKEENAMDTQNSDDEANDTDEDITLETFDMGDYNGFCCDLRRLLKQNAKRRRARSRARRAHALQSRGRRTRASRSRRSHRSRQRCRTRRSSGSQH